MLNKRSRNTLFFTFQQVGWANVFARKGSAIQLDVFWKFFLYGYSTGSTLFENSGIVN